MFHSRFARGEYGAKCEGRSSRTSLLGVENISRTGACWRFSLSIHFERSLHTVEAIDSLET